MADDFTKEAFTLLGVGVAVVALRTYARFTSVGIRNFMLDDYLMLLAVVSSLALQELAPQALTFRPRSSTDWRPQLPTRLAQDSMDLQTIA